MLSRLITFFVFFLIVLGGSTFAADTILQNLQNLTSTREGSYKNQYSYSQNDLRLINLGNDTNPVGDYFQGSYFDPMHGIFQMQVSSSRVSISGVSASGCNAGYTGKKLTGSSWSILFGFMNFSGVSVCLPQNINPATESLPGYLMGYAFSPLIGFQSFDGWTFDTTIDICDPTVDSNCTGDDSTTGRLTKIEGNVSSQNSKTGTITDQFDGDVRIVGKVTKSSLRKNIQEKIYLATRSLPDGESIIYNNEVKVYKNPGGVVDINQSSFGTNIRTIVIENGSAKIVGNIREKVQDEVKLPQQPVAIIALSGSNPDTDSGNIYIDPNVTDIESSLYADKSIMSYGPQPQVLYTNSEPQDALKNQLYIYGTVFSENTIGGSFDNPPRCPYYINSICTELTAQKYDVNFLRRYKLVTPIDANGDPGLPSPAFGGQQSYARTNSRGGNASYNIYPVIIEYNPQIQQKPPIFF